MQRLPNRRAGKPGSDWGVRAALLGLANGRTSTKMVHSFMASKERTVLGAEKRQILMVREIVRTGRYRAQAWPEGKKKRAKR